MAPARLADLVVVLHLGYVLFVVLGLVAVLAGAACGWRWVRAPWFRWLHLVCTLVVPLESLGGVVCPLTSLEAALRRSAGQPTEDISFVGRLVREVLFYQAPEWVFTAGYILFAALVVLAFLRFPPRRRGAAAGA